MTWIIPSLMSDKGGDPASAAQRTTEIEEKPITEHILGRTYEQVRSRHGRCECCLFPLYPELGEPIEGKYCSNTCARQAGKKEDS